MLQVISKLETRFGQPMVACWNCQSNRNDGKVGLTLLKEVTKIFSPAQKNSEDYFCFPILSEPENL